MKLLTLNYRQADFLRFVQEAHSGQKRKYTGEDYWNHPFNVACLVHQNLDDAGLLIEVSFGHDLFEDTKVTADILRAFMKTIGYNDQEILYVVLGVSSLTDKYTSKEYPTWNRKMRKGWEAEKLALIHPDYQTVKYADLIDNLGSIVEYDFNFATLYTVEKEHILSRMRHGNINLLIKAYQTLWEGQANLIKQKK